MISEVQGALRKSGGFVFGDRLPFLAISTCGTLFTEASQERGTFLRRQGIKSQVGVAPDSGWP